MGFLPTRKSSIFLQIFWSLFSVFFVALLCFVAKDIVGYRIVALILLMTVSLLAMLFDILAVLLASILSAIIWNFFFIPPIFTFHIDNTEDLLMFFLYFVIALINAVLTYQIRKEEQKSRDKEEKEKTIKLYDTLLNSLSHELRTPISTILSSVDMLQENENISKENQKEILNQIDIATIRLNGQVENLLNMSRLESGMLKLNLDWEDISDLINSVIQKTQTNFPARKIKFKSKEKLPLCKIDSGILEQVLYNILQNAVQYTPEKSQILLETEIKNKQLRITIQDQGKGIPEEFLKNIFEKFYRLPNSKAGGIGLGLSIVKGFLEAHGGTIAAENCLPTGLKFTLKIPVEVSYINNLKNE